MRFLSPLITKKHSVPGEFVLYSKFVIDFEQDKKPYRMAIPAGFITDFASVPKLVQLLPGFGVNENSANAAVVHDFAYCSKGELRIRDLSTGDLVSLSLSRKECDGLLYDGLISSGYSSGVANLFYLGVRIGGGAYWRKRSDGLRSDFDFVPETFVENPQ